MAEPSPSRVHYRDDAVLIRLKPQAARSVPRPLLESTRGSLGLAGLDAASASLGGVRFEREFKGETSSSQEARAPDFSAFWIAHLPARTGRDAAIERLGATAEVESVSPIAWVSVNAIPNDSLWSYAYYLYQPSRRDIHAVEAWDVTTGDTSVVVAILDTGVIPYHPDLARRIWTNWAERGGIPGVDDDGNGFIDDSWGWDFVDLPSDTFAVEVEDGQYPDNDPNDFVGHGTGVAGVVGAETNNRIGVAGAAWNVRLMPLRVGWSARRSPSGEIDLSYVAQAIRYATRMGASVINCSFSSVRQPDLDIAVSEATRAGVIVVAAAGNGEPDHYLPDRPDVISVAALDSGDRVTGYSSRGAFVDIAAAGNSFATTAIARPGTDSLGMRQPTYSRGASGTSFSAPLVAGGVALLQSDRRQHGLPPYAPADMLLRLSETADDISAANPGQGGYGAGRLNVFRALREPRTSFVLHVGSRIAGPAVVLPTMAPPARAAVATEDGRLIVLDGASGEILLSVALPARPQGGIAAADLGGGHGLGMFVATSDGRISGFDAFLRPLPGWPVVASTSRNVRNAEPALGDLDGDGVLEVIWGGGDGNVRAWRVDGTPVTGFPRFVESTVRNALVALADLDGAPGVEIVVTSYSDFYRGLVYVLHGDGSIAPNWPRSISDVPAAPVIGHFASNPDPVIVVCSGYRVEVLTPDAQTLWERSPPGIVSGDPALVDLDRNGSDEIVLARSGQNEIAVLDSTGLEIPGWPQEMTGAPSGSPIVGYLAGAGRAGILQNLLRTGPVVFDLAGRQVRGFPKPGEAGEYPTLADLDGDGRTEMIAGSAHDSLIYIYDAGAGTWSAGPALWPTARGNNARTGSSFYSPPMARVDNQSPAAVADLSQVALADSAVELSWTAPADQGVNAVARYELRYSRAPPDEGNFGAGSLVPGLATPGAPGASEHARIEGLDENTTYFFALRSFDESGNKSSLSNRVQITTVGRAPEAVADLRVVGSGDSTVILVWTATGDDGRQGRPRTYLLRASESPIGESSFDLAPIAADVAASSDAGGGESATLVGVRRGRRYWIAVEARDDAGNRSRISNVVSTWIGPLAGRTGVALAVGEGPTRLPVTLYWQGSGSAAGQEIRVFDAAGRLEQRFTLGAGTEGLVTWDGRGREGHMAPAGLYFARFTSGGSNARAKIVLLR